MRCIIDAIHIWPSTLLSIASYPYISELNDYHETNQQFERNVIHEWISMAALELLA